MYLLRILIGSLYCLHLLRLARVITLVLVLNLSSSFPSKQRDVLRNVGLFLSLRGNFILLLNSKS